MAQPERAAQLLAERAQALMPAKPRDPKLAAESAVAEAARQLMHEQERVHGGRVPPENIAALAQRPDVKEIAASKLAAEPPTEEGQVDKVAQQIIEAAQQATPAHGIKPKLSVFGQSPHRAAERIIETGTKALMKREEANRGHVTRDSAAAEAQAAEARMHQRPPPPVVVAVRDRVQELMGQETAAEE